MIITKPGDFKLRNGKRVTVHEIKEPPGHVEGNTSFPVKGSIWKSHKDIGLNPDYGIWQRDGRWGVWGDEGRDIVAEWPNKH